MEISFIEFFIPLWFSNIVNNQTSRSLLFTSFVSFLFFSPSLLNNFLFLFLLVNTSPSPGLLSVWRWDQRLQSPVCSHHTHHWYLWANAMFQRGKPWATEDSVCTGCLQVAEKARPVPSRQYLCPSLLVRSQHRQKWWRGVLELFCFGYCWFGGGFFVFFHYFKHTYIWKNLCIREGNYMCCAVSTYHQYTHWK